MRFNIGLRRCFGCNAGLAGGDYQTIALVGNPNTGKTTLFNHLTGMRHHVGNFPGATVDKREGFLESDGSLIRVIDLPGTYSLAASAEDEAVVVNYLRGQIPGERKPDLVVCTVEAANLERNLFLVSQVAELNLPMVLVLNMVDELEARGGGKLDLQLLSERFSIPVVETVAVRGRGIDRLKSVVADTLSKGGENGCYKGKAPCCCSDSIEGRYRWLDQNLQGVVKNDHTSLHLFSDRVDKVLLHRYFGIFFLLAVMFGMFQSLYLLADPLMSGIEGAVGFIGDVLGGQLVRWPILKSLVVDGALAGVGAVFAFLPLIAILFVFIAMLEDSGYLARAALLMDRVLSWCGLNGRSFVPLLSSFACAVPAIMSARVIGERKARITTILLAPLMSCSARLPIYVLMTGALIEPKFGAFWAATVVVGMHLLGLAVAIPTALLLKCKVLRGESSPLLLELPPYRWPSLRNVYWRVFERVREFVLRAGTLILFVSMGVWAASYFPGPGELEGELKSQAVAERGLSGGEANLELTESEYELRLASLRLENSYLGRVGRWAQPVFAPAGFDWRTTVAILASFPAREVMVAALGVLYNVGSGVDQQSGQLRGALAAATWPDGRPVYTPLTALAVMVFMALSLQCGATLVVIARESSWQWAVGAFFFQSALAWVAAVVVYQLGVWISGLS